MRMVPILFDDRQNTRCDYAVRSAEVVVDFCPRQGESLRVREDIKYLAMSR
jgi:hypothetical protein